MLHFHGSNLIALLHIDYIDFHKWRLCPAILDPLHHLMTGKARIDGQERCAESVFP